MYKVVVKHKSRLLSSSQVVKSGIPLEEAKELARKLTFKNIRNPDVFISVVAC